MERFCRFPAWPQSSGSPPLSWLPYNDLQETGPGVHSCMRGTIMAYGCVQTVDITELEVSTRNVQERLARRWLLRETRGLGDSQAFEPGHGIHAAPLRQPSGERILAEVPARQMLGSWISGMRAAGAAVAAGAGCNTGGEA